LDQVVLFRRVARERRIHEEVAKLDGVGRVAEQKRMESAPPWPPAIRTCDAMPPPRNVISCLLVTSNSVAVAKFTL
jgi:hypothetical protein